MGANLRVARNIIVLAGRLLPKSRRFPVSSDSPGLDSGETRMLSIICKPCQVHFGAVSELFRNISFAVLFLSLALPGALVRAAEGPRKIA